MLNTELDRSMEDFVWHAGFENTELKFFYPGGLSWLYNLVFLVEFFLTR